MENIYGFSYKKPSNPLPVSPKAQKLRKDFSAKRMST